ncbi:MAG: cation:proton antiporter [Cypionkella sp.]
MLLTQDIAVIPMLALIPLLASTAILGPTLGSVRHHQCRQLQKAVEGAAEPLVTIVQSLPGWAAGLLTLTIVAGIVLAGNYLSRPVFRFVHAAKLPEMSTFISLLLVLGIAFLMILVGLSPALGTFVAGVVLANSEFRHQLEADLKPFKGLLVGPFLHDRRCRHQLSYVPARADDGAGADTGPDVAQGRGLADDRLCLSLAPPRPLAFRPQPRPKAVNSAF